MSSLPTELLRTICCYATAVTSSLNEDDCSGQQAFGLYMVIQPEVAISMRTKCAISLVSRQFHQICDEFLYEIIHVRDRQHIEPLVTLLRTNSTSGTSRGWWCRRIFVDLHRGYHHWNSGRHDLWGLLPACPRLWDLRCDITLDITGFRRAWHTTRYPPSPRMLHTVAKSLGSQLRIIVFGYQVAITIDAAAMLLSHLPALEICRFRCLRAPWPLLEEPDSEDEEDREPSPDIWEGKSEASDDEPGAATGEHATAPAAIRLLYLRVLHCNVFVPQVAQWDLPNLQEVVVGMDRNYGARKSFAVICHGLRPHSPHITHFTYANGPPVNLWYVAEMLPNLEYLAYGNSQFDLDDAVISHPLERLHTIVINRRPAYDNKIPLLLLDLTTSVIAGMLPALRRVLFVGEMYGKDEIQKHADFFDSHGIRLCTEEEGEIKSGVSLDG